MDTPLTATFITAIVTIFVALIGYLVTYWNNIRISQRTERLNRINKQLAEFYGPLYSLIDTENQAWGAFRGKHRPGRPFFGTNPPPTDKDLEAWRLWMTTIFMPRNLQMYELIVTKADLLIEADIPDCLRALSAHVTSYQAVMKKWENNDFSEHTPVINFPAEELTKYTRQSFTYLKNEQEKLLGKVTKR